MMTLRAVAFRFPADSARSRSGKLSPASPRPPIVNAARRLIRERRKSGQQAGYSRAISGSFRSTRHVIREVVRPFFDIGPKRACRLHAILLRDVWSWFLLGRRRRLA